MLTQQLMFCLFSFQLENGLREISTRKNRNATPLRDGKPLGVLVNITHTDLETLEARLFL